MWEIFHISIADTKFIKRRSSLPDDIFCPFLPAFKLPSFSIITSPLHYGRRDESVKIACSSIFGCHRNKHRNLQGGGRINFLLSKSVDEKCPYLPSLHPTPRVNSKKELKKNPLKCQVFQHNSRAHGSGVPQRLYPLHTISLTYFRA